ncbi:major facilitator superfamily domain-containing protein 9-like [Oscarella lobularis]|uniref:major facilitator superfamily domain-containing protein 9-like n=1 Tax=Oscarella lobularis TaxID=121494 RepID=UPI0033144A4E
MQPDLNSPKTSTPSDPNRSTSPKASLLAGIYLVGFLDLAAVGVIVPFFPKHLENLGASPALAGTYGSLYGALQLLSSPLVGRLSDLHGRRRILLVVLLSCTVGYFLIGMAPNLFLLFLLRIPTGIFKHSLSLGKGCLADVTSEEKRPAQLGHYNGISSAGFIVGPIVGGHAVAYGGFQMAATLAAFVFAVNFLIAYFLVRMDGTDVTAAGNREVYGDSFRLKEAIMIHRSPTWPKVSRLMTQRLLMGVGMIMFRGSFTLFLSHKFNTTPQQNGYIQSYMALVSAILSTQVGRISTLYPNKSALMCRACLMTVVTELAVTFAPSLAFVYVALVPLALATTTLRAITTHLCIEAVSTSERGEVMGIGQSMLSLARIIGPQVSGLALQVGNEVPGLVGAAVSLVGTGLVYKHGRDQRQRSGAHEKDE